MTTAITQMNQVDLGRLDLARAEELCRESPQVAAQILMAIASRNTMELPNTAFVRRGKDLMLSKVRVGRRLTESDGHLIRMSNRKVKTGPGKNDFEWMPAWDLSLDGIRALNSVAALQAIRPECVMVDGERRMNPYMVIDEVSALPTVVYARCLCVGYSPTGTLCATDSMIRLDLKIYLLENMQAKMKSDSRWSRYGVEKVAPSPEDGGCWIFMPLHPPAGLWYDVQSPEYAQIIGDHTTRLKFVERLAQSFAERNAFKAHPAMPKELNVQNGVANVPMISWVSEFSRDDLLRLRELVEHDSLHEFKDSDGRSLTIESVVNTDEMDEASKADLDMQAQSAADAEGGNSDENEGDADAAERVVAGKDAIEQAMTKYSALLDGVGAAGAKKVVKEAGIESIEEATADELTKFMELADKELTE